MASDSETVKEGFKMREGSGYLAPLEAQNSADLDELRLQAQGHKSELPRNFSFLSLLSLSYSIMMSWITFISVILATLQSGGPPASFWTPLVSCAANFIITLGLAELTSAFPSTGGPYHFAFMVAPENLRAPAAFAAGWFNTAAYLFAFVSGTNYTANNILGIASIYVPSYEYKTWQVWLVYSLLAILATVIVSIAPTAVPKTQTIFFWGSITAMVSISITLLAASPSKLAPEAVFIDWENSSGWSNGFAFMIAVGQSTWLFSAVDSATHIAEEVPQPHRNVPIVMLSSLGVGIVTVMLFSLAILFSCPDFAAVAASPSPIYAAFQQAVPGGVALFFSIWVLLLVFGGELALVITCGRLVWAFARDNGIPFSNRLARVHPRLQIPLEANIFSCAIVVALGAIAIGSTTAFNTFISSAILFFNLSYVVPQLMVLVRGREHLPNRYLKLSPAIGTFCNVFTVAWTALFIVIFSFPLFIPVTLETMNYVSVILVAMVLLIVAMWFFGKRKQFTGPIVNLEVLEAFSVPARPKTGVSDKDH